MDETTYGEKTASESGTEFPANSDAGSQRKPDSVPGGVPAGSVVVSAAESRISARPDVPDLPGITRHPTKDRWVIKANGKGRWMTEDERVHYLAGGYWDFGCREDDLRERWHDRWKAIFGHPHPESPEYWHWREQVKAASETPSPYGRTGSIYFFHAPTLGLVKIGFTGRDPGYRMADCQIGSPVKLVLLGVIPAQRSEEFDIHARFAAYREHGEWFRLEGELAEFVAETLGSKVS